MLIIYFPHFFCLFPLQRYFWLLSRHFSTPFSPFFFQLSLVESPNLFPAFERRQNIISCLSCCNTSRIEFNLSSKQFSLTPTLFFFFFFFFWRRFRSYIRPNSFLYIKNHKAFIFLTNPTPKPPKHPDPYRSESNSQISRCLFLRLFIYFFFSLFFSFVFFSFSLF